MKKKAKCIDIIVYAVLILFGAAALFPVIFIAASSLMDESEVIRSYVSGEMDFHIIPRSFSMNGYREVFLYTPSYVSAATDSRNLALRERTSYSSS